MFIRSSLADIKVTDVFVDRRATLAQRLNELAVANADGLLKYVSTILLFMNWNLCLYYSDDEYRILRQNLFERFSTASEIPSESPVVPAVRPRPKPTGTGPNTPERSMSDFIMFIHMWSVLG